MAANGGNVTHVQAIILLHLTQYAHSRWYIVQYTSLQQLWIYDSFDDFWFAKHCTISVFKMSWPTDFQKL